MSKSLLAIHPGDFLAEILIELGVSQAEFARAIHVSPMRVSHVVAEQAHALIGFVTIDGSGYLDQLVVSPNHWGSKLATALVDEAKRLSPDRITLLVNKDNTRAIRFYERNGFAHAGEDVNPTSGRPVLKMAWKG